jgi:hypothetical protein
LEEKPQDLSQENDGLPLSSTQSATAPVHQTQTDDKDSKTDFQAKPLPETDDKKEEISSNTATNNTKVPLPGLAKENGSLPNISDSKTALTSNAPFISVDTIEASSMAIG